MAFTHTIPLPQVAPQPILTGASLAMRHLSVVGALMDSGALPSVVFHTSPTLSAPPSHTIPTPTAPSARPNPHPLTGAHPVRTGGSLAMYHLGVVGALMDGGALPSIVSGTSGGAIVAGVLAIHTDEEMRE